MSLGMSGRVLVYVVDCLCYAVCLCDLYSLVEFSLMYDDS